MRAIRRDLLVRFLISIVPMVVLGCTLLFCAAWYILVTEFDASFRAEAGALASMTERVGMGVDFDYDLKSMPDFTSLHVPQYFELWLSDGSVLQRSDSLGARDLAPIPAEFGRLAITPCVLPDGRRGRACSLTFEPRPVRVADHKGEVDRPDAPAGPVTLVIQRGTEEYTRPLTAFGVLLGTVGAGMTGALVAVIRRGVRRGLTPLDRLGQRVTEIDVSSLHERLDIAALPRELRPIAARLNELLARLQSSLQRERRFAASAAHELRTPVAEVRTMAEVALRQTEGDSPARRALGAIAEVAEQMTGTISALLGLARAHGGTGPLSVATVDAAAVMHDQWSRRAGVLRKKSLRTSISIDPSLRVESDPVMFTSIVSNLIDNAVSHTPDHGEISISGTISGSAARLRFENTASDLRPADIDCVFDPFWRKNGARAGANHSGLGLALVRVMCETLGAKVWAELGDNRFIITVSHPGSTVTKGDAGAPGHDATVGDATNLVNGRA